MSSEQLKLPIKRMIEIEYIEGDVVAQTKHEKLLVDGKGISIKDDQGNECFMQWKLFLKYYSYLRLLEQTANITSSLVERHKMES